jgi:phage repressor protein C with HTH and peptisase S24 domain
MDKYELRRLTLLKLMNSECNGKIADLAKKLGRSDSYVSRMLYEEGKAGRKRIGDDMKDVIESTFGISLDAREFKPNKSNVIPLQKDPPVQLPPTRAENTGYVKFPLIDAPHGMGGNLTPVDHPEILKYIEVTEEWARRSLNSNFADIKIVPAVGDSMAGTIDDGSVVFVDVSSRYFAGDGLYAIVWQGRLQIKRLQARHDEKRLKIISDNKLYEADWANEDLIISGRVLAAWNFKRF